MINNLTENEITKSWSDWKCEAPPLVSIRCIAYNQEKYIEDTLNGFLMQKTDFPFEIIVHDDASTDRTAKIIKEYADRFPHIIQPILETENQYSKGGTHLADRVKPYLRGKYIALCEGDDYWIDPSKLQKQIDFLESHSDFGMCYTEFDIKDEVNNTYRKRLFHSEPQKYPMTYNLEEWILKKGYVAPMTWVILKELWDTYEKLDSCDGTYVMFAHFLANSNVKCLDEYSTAVYRIIKESASHFTNVDKIYSRVKNLHGIQHILISKYNLSAAFSDSVDTRYYNRSYKPICVCGSRQEREECYKHIKSLKFRLFYYLTSIGFIRAFIKNVYSSIKNR